jgi:hypothetical protein
VSLRRLRGAERPWQIVLPGATREIRLSSRALLSPRLLRRAAQRAGVAPPAMSDAEMLREIARALADHLEAAA